MESKFSGVFAKLKQPLEEQETATPAAPVVRGRGRPPGKRSDPDYQPTTVFLRKHTKRKANRLLEDQEAGQDLSDLLEQLLTEWIQQHSEI
jgi:hypothetical protein